MVNIFIIVGFRGGDRPNRPPPGSAPDSQSHINNGFFRLVEPLLLLLFTQYETTWITATSSHCLITLPSKTSVFKSHMGQNAYSIAVT